jgi:hypothetical protein
MSQLCQHAQWWSGTTALDSCSVALDLATPRACQCRTTSKFGPAVEGNLYLSTNPGHFRAELTAWVLNTPFPLWGTTDT